MMILESTLNNVANRTADVFLIWEIPDTSSVSEFHPDSAVQFGQMEQPLSHINKLSEDHAITSVHLNTA